MKLFHQHYPQETPFQTYLLPQALLELKARLSTNTKQHIVLNSRLHTKSYRDEVFEMLSQVGHVEEQGDALIYQKTFEQIKKHFYHTCHNNWNNMATISMMPFLTTSFGRAAPFLGY